LRLATVSADGGGPLGWRCPFPLRWRRFRDAPPLMLPVSAVRHAPPVDDQALGKRLKYAALRSGDGNGKRQLRRR
jgi:hypothetical protein